MFAVFQLPLTDARPFSSAATGRLNSPHWGIPKTGEFIRSFGSVAKRRRGGVAEWAGEGVYCDAGRAIRLPSRLRERHFGANGEFTGFRCAFRRFLSDGGAVSRLEIGLAGSLSRGQRVTRRNLLLLIESLGQLPVKVPLKDDVISPAQPLLSASRMIAQHYLRASTAALAVNGLAKWWLTPCEPAILVEYRLDEAESLPKFAGTVTTLTDQGLSLTRLVIQHKGDQIGVWLLGVALGADRDVARRLRIHLLRLHAERECLKQMLRHIIDGRLDTTGGKDNPLSPGNRLQQYLSDAESLFTAGTRYGIAQSEILKVAYSYDQFISEGDRATLLTLLKTSRPSVQRTVASYASSTRQEAGVYIIENSQVSIGTINKTEGQTVNQINIGDNATITDSNIAIAERIVGSMNTIQKSGASDEVKVQLKQLHEAVGELVKHLPEDKAKQVAQDLETLSAETVSPTPRPRWWQLSSEGLIEAATTVAKIGEPVIASVKALAGLLAMV
jgi:hypothetical protein